MYQKLSEFIQDPQNANRGTPEGDVILRRSIRELGAGRSIVIDKNGFIIAGNKTANAAIEEGFDDAVVVKTDGSQVVVVQRTDLDLSQDPKAKQLAIADNRIGEINLNWDPVVLENIANKVDLGWLEINDEWLEELEGIEEDTGFVEGLTDEDDVPEIGDSNGDSNIETRCKRGDIWQLGRHRLMCGDSTVITDVERLINGHKVDMVFTDPPYGISIVNAKSGTVGAGNIAKARQYAEIEGDDSTDCAREFYQVCIAILINSFVIWGGNYFTDFLPPSPCWLIWDKQNGDNNFADVEIAWTSSSGGSRLYSYLWNGLIRAGDRKTELVSRVHPTQKPVGLFVEIFKDFEFESCLDGFLGSGSTLIACEKTGRTCYGMEVSEHYCDVILKRWEDFTGQEAVLIVE